MRRLIIESLPLLVASGAAALGVLYYYLISRDDGKPDLGPTTDPGWTVPVDCSAQDLYPMSDEAGVSGAHADSAVAEIPHQTDTLAEAERRCEEAIESNTHLERNNIYLTSKLNVLENELSWARISCNDIMRKLEDEREERRKLESRCEEMDGIIKQHEELRKDYEQEVKAHASLRATMAELERKYMQAMESNLKLQNEKSELQGLVLDMRNKYSETENILKIQQMQQTVSVKDLALLDNEKKELEAALAQSNSELENTQSQNDQLEDECTILRATVGTLEDEVRRLENELSHCQAVCDDLMRDYDHKDRTLKNLEAKWKMMNETVLNDYEEQIKVQSNLRLQYNELKEQHEQLVKEREDKQLSLAVATESNALLERVNNELVSQVNILRRSMMELKEELSELHRHNKEMEHGQLQGTSRIMQLQLDPACLTEVDRYLIATLAETEQKLTRARRFAAVFEQERADLKYHIGVLRSSVHELEQMLSDAEKKCEFLKQEKDQALESLNLLRTRGTRKHQCDDLVPSCSKDLEPKEEDDPMKPM